MMNSAIEYAGKLRHNTTGLPLPGLKVEAWDLRRRGGAPLSATYSDEAGLFRLSLPTSIRGAGTTIFFRVSSDEAVLVSTEDSVRWDARASARGDLEVDPDRILYAKPSVATNRYTIQGSVVRPAGESLTSAVVKVFKKNAVEHGVSREELASVSVTVPTPTSSAFATPHRGRYTASFSLPTSESAPSLVVEASTGGTAFAETDVANAGLRETVDVIDTVDRAEHPTFKRLVLAVGPHRPMVGVDPVPGRLDWSDKHVLLFSELAREPAAKIQQLGDAERLAEAVEGAVDTEVLFGLVSQRLPSTIGRLLSRGRSSLRAALESARASGEIDEGIDVDAALLSLEDAAVEQLMLTTHPDIVPIGALVSLTSLEDPLDLATRKKLVRHVIQNDGVAAAVWAAVEADDDIALGDKIELRLRVDLSRLAKDHRPMTTALRARPGLTTARDAAKLTRAAIRALVDTISPHYPEGTEGEDETARRDAYAKAVGDAIEREHRTAFHVATFGTGTAARAFFDANASFDFTEHRVARYLAENSTALDTIAEVDRPGVVSRLKAEERLFRVTEWSHEVTSLRAAGYASAHAIQAHGFSRFKATMAASGLDDRTVATIHARARTRNGAAHAMLARYSSVTSNPLGLGTAGHPTMFPQSTLTVDSPKLADWTSLFGTLDSCRCEHCLSVLSPAAYLVDLLQFLRRVDGPGASDGRDAFLARRPDVQYLLLDCPSATTPMPLIDLVNEIMEARTGALEAELDFPEEWPDTIIGTRGTALELESMPEPVYDLGDAPAEFLRNLAYLHLRSRRFPFRAQYDLWGDEAASYLAALGVERHELVRLLAPPRRRRDCGTPRMPGRHCGSARPGLRSRSSQVRTRRRRRTTGASARAT